MIERYTVHVPHSCRMPKNFVCVAKSVKQYLPIMQEKKTQIQYLFDFHSIEIDINCNIKRLLFYSKFLNFVFFTG